MTTIDVSSSSRTVTINRGKHLDQEPRTGHNRWHPDIEPILEVEPGEQVVLETRDALDGYLNAQSSVADLASIPMGVVHPLTGPVFVKGTKSGDLLEIEFVDIQPQPWAFSSIMPGLGFLRDTMTTPFLVHWQIANGWATSPQLPGVRVPGASFMGVSGVAPSARQVAEWTGGEAGGGAHGGVGVAAHPRGAGPALRRDASQGVAA